MSDYIEPTQAEFNSGEQVAMDVMTTAYPKLLTKTGSVLRELLIRPMAYAYSWLSANFSDMREKTTVAWLKNSSATENPVADAVASNYFVTRRQGVRSKGVITIVLSTTSAQLDAGSMFEVDGVQLVTETRIIAMGTEYRMSDGVQYVPVLPYNSANGTYMANIPVVSVETGDIELAPGGIVNMDFANSSIVDAMLTSPVSGGRDTETDAELMARAEYNTAESGIGSYYGIRKKLSKAPVDVIGMNLVAGEDTPIFRARYNTVGVSPGGFVDCHVKTYGQYAATTVNKTPVAGSAANTWQVLINSTDCAGAFAVRGVIADGTAIDDYMVDFGSDSEYTSPAGARLGVHQTITVSFTSEDDLSAAEVAVTLLYMPGIASLQQYMDSSDNMFVGQSLMVKAAVPLSMTLACKMEYDGTPDDDILEGIRKCMADRVQAYPVGAYAVNFSDLQKAVHESYPRASLRLPCTMSASLALKDGTAAGEYSTSGILSAAYPASATEWDPAICFFSLIPDNIRIELI